MKGPLTSPANMVARFLAGENVHVEHSEISSEAVERTGICVQAYYNLAVYQHRDRLNAIERCNLWRETRAICR